MNIYLSVNPDKKNFYKYTQKACEIFKSHDAKIFTQKSDRKYLDGIDGIEYGDETNIKKCQMILAIGGDGTILNMAYTACKYDKPILGVNCGRLGFLAGVEHNEISKLERIFTGNFHICKRMMLKISIDKNVFYALNDAVITKPADAKIADFEVKKNKVSVTSQRADGVIFSTATGSTAYSLGAGGAIIEPDLNCIEMTHICPHSLFNRSVIFAKESRLTVHCNKAGAAVVADGNEIAVINPDSCMEITGSNHFVSIVDLTESAFFRAVNSKLLTPLKGKL